MYVKIGIDFDLGIKTGRFRNRNNPVPATLSGKPNKLIPISTGINS